MKSIDSAIRHITVDFSPYCFDSYTNLKSTKLELMSTVIQSGELENLLCLISSHFRSIVELKQYQPSLYNDLTKLNINIKEQVKFRIPMYSEIIKFIDDSKIQNQIVCYDGYKNFHEWIKNGDIYIRIACYEMGFINNMA